MALDPSTPRSRRAILLAAAGAAAATALSAGRPTSVRAAGDDNSPILVGSTFLDVRTGTYLSDSATNATVFSAVSSSAGGQGAGTGVAGVSGSGTGVAGTSGSGIGVDGSSDSDSGVRGISSSYIGVEGSSTSNAGVRGISSSDVGVQGHSSSLYGVYGTSNATNQPAIIGQSYGNSSGVQGHSGTGFPLAAKAKTGVFGYANQDATATGVRGESVVGVGVRGKATTGYAGYFDGRVFTTRYYEMVEVTTPNAPAANQARLFVKDNGAGKTQLCVRFHTGSVKILVTES